MTKKKKKRINKVFPPISTVCFETLDFLYLVHRYCMATKHLKLASMMNKIRLRFYKTNDHHKVSKALHLHRILKRLLHDANDFVSERMGFLKKKKNDMYYCVSFSFFFFFFPFIFSCRKKLGSFYKMTLADTLTTLEPRMVLITSAGDNLEQNVQTCIKFHSLKYLKKMIGIKTAFYLFVLP